jgi:fatty acid desaturase
LADRKRRGPDQWLDLACLVTHVVLFLIAPCALFPWQSVLLLYAAHVVLTGIGLFAVLAPGHYPADAACLSSEQRGAADFFRRQGIATVNFRTGWLGRFLCAGLEHQVEHHFFPTVSHVHLRAMAPLVEQFCRHRGIPYRRLGWGEAVWKSWLVFFQPKPVVNDITSALATTVPRKDEDLPLVAQDPSEA